MAVEKDFELLDDYLANRLNANDAAAFEKQVEGDPQLAQELSIQKGLVEGLKKARAAELKAMLNNIPVAPVNGGSSALVKTGTWVVVAGLVATGLYFYFSQDEETASAKVTNEQPTVVTPEVKEVEPSATEETQPQPDQTQVEQQPVAVVEENEKKKEKTTATQPAAKPKPVEAYDPSAEEPTEAVKKYEHEQLEVVSKAFVTSSIEVETDTMHKKYNFHYVFSEGKLILYGAFEKHLYEILEFIGDEKRTVVLFYKTNYYLLDINKTTPTKLAPIHDAKLLKKLKEHRSK